MPDFFSKLSPISFFLHLCFFLRFGAPTRPRRGHEHRWQQNPSRGDKTAHTERVTRHATEAYFEFRRSYLRSGNPTSPCRSMSAIPAQTSQMVQLRWNEFVPRVTSAVSSFSTYVLLKFGVEQFSHCFLRAAPQTLNARSVPGRWTTSQAMNFSALGVPLLKPPQCVFFLFFSIFFLYLFLLFWGCV